MNSSQHSLPSESMGALAALLSVYVDRMVMGFMEALSAAKSEGLLRRLRSDAAVRARFEIYLYAVLFTDVTAMARQPLEVRKRLFEVMSREMLESLKSVAPEYDEAVFDRELYERMCQYAAVMKEPTTLFQVPLEVRIWEILQASLTEAVCAKGLFSNRKKETDIVSIAYRESCTEKEQAMRLLVTNLLSASDDFGMMAQEDFERIMSRTQETIIARLGLEL